MKKTLIYVAFILGGIAVSCQPKSPGSPVFEAKGTDSLTFAMIDTDIIFEKHDMVADVMKELEEIETRLTADLQRQARNLQNDYQNFVNVGYATMTRSEQEKKEAQLNKRGEELQQLEQRYMQQLMEARAQKNQEVEDRIFAFIEEYNKENGNFSIILSKARTSGTLYSLPSMDITDPVLTALNEDYSKNRKNK